MFPILPILILFLLGPTNVERLAAEGRLPAGLLAIHLAHVAPIRATVVAPEEESELSAVTRQSGFSAPEDEIVRLYEYAAIRRDNPACPTRAGPGVA